MKLTANRIAAMSDHQQIMDCVESVTKNLKDYNKEKDIITLENLKDICIEEKMVIEMAEMYRNIGMYHFYANNLNEATISMQLAVDILRMENCTKLLAEYYSDLGLVYFYNHEYLYSRRYYEEAEKLLAQESDIDKHIAYLHYFRYGMLLNSMQEYTHSKLKLEKALSFAEDDKDTALIIMNFGILAKKQKDMKTALKFYSKALWLVGDKDMKLKGIVYNNIAEVYKTLGQYEKALSYIDRAFKCISDDNLSRLFVFFNTYTEIKILMGEREAVLDKFLQLLGRVKEFHLYRALIIEGIRNMIVIGSEDESILERLETAILKLIKENAYGHDEFVRELKACLENIRLYLKDQKII
ncbi:MAG TPA: tetratricopeptide repeat protein [Clostridia bacterium]|nr:tetratricopeptide repeat protein [Clostridia bacterium]